MIRKLNHISALIGICILLTAYMNVKYLINYTNYMHTSNRISEHTGMIHPALEERTNLTEKNISQLDSPLKYITMEELCPQAGYKSPLDFQAFPHLLEYKSSIEQHFQREKKCACPVEDAAAKTQRLPHAIIIGVDKAGTSALRFFLEAHPDIVFPPLCELQYFYSNTMYKDWGFDWYLHNMGLSAPGQLTMEKSPMYYRQSRVCAARIHAMDRSMRILVALADPVRRTLSDYLERRAWTPEYQNKSFQELIQLPNGELNEAFDPLQVSVYHKRLRVWLNMFPREQIHIVNGDKLASDLPAEMERVERFLGVRRYITEDKVVFVRNKGPRGLFCLKGNYSNAQALCLGGDKGRTHPNVSEELRRKMADYFTPHNQELYKMVDYDFGWS